MLFSSSTSRLTFPAPLRAEARVLASVGDVVVVDVLSENASYPYLEQPDGSLARVCVGDRVVGVLGSRRALRGFVGRVPETLEPGDTLSLLNMGGVIGRYVDSTSELGEPAHVRYVGTLVDDEGPLNMRRGALPTSFDSGPPRPVVLVIGTCMSTGKTCTVAGIISSATRAGHRVGAAKLSGVAALRDLRKFSAAGAVDVKSFMDYGLPSTVDAEDLAPVVKTVTRALDGDLLVVELGDGIMGHYHVESALTDPEIMRNVAAVVVCAGDLVAAYGAKVFLDGLGVRIDAFSGLATENVSGSAYIEERLGVPAVNGVKEPDRLFAALGVGEVVLA